MDLEKKLTRLKSILTRMGSVVIAYSGGVDSALLLRIAKDILGKNVLAVTADSPTYTKDELYDAKYMAGKIGVKHLIIHTEEFKNPEFAKNPVNRCYFCKKELFSKLKNIAKKYKFNYCLDATNLDDKKDYRPGAKAKEEFGIRSPLQEARFTKNDIRRLSRNLGLPTWNKPSLACLASRIPYNCEITRNKLKAIETAEFFLKSKGLRQVRVRHHDGICRIEVDKKDISKVVTHKSKIITRFKELGYKYITLDLEGYRTGSMNLVLP